MVKIDLTYLKNVLVFPFLTSNILNARDQVFRPTKGNLRKIRSMELVQPFQPHSPIAQADSPVMNPESAPWTSKFQDY